MPTPFSSLPLIADGAIGWWLARGSGRGDLPPEELNLNRPDSVRAAHRAFLGAGANLHRTNTRGAASVLLEPWGLADRCEAVTNSASALVREVVGAGGLVMGSLGEIPATSPAGRIPQPARQRSYAEQIVYLSDTGVTFLLLEHFRSLEESLLVLRLAGGASDAPVLALLSVDGAGMCPDGVPAAEAGARLVDGGAGALGIGCGSAQQGWERCLEALLPLGVPVGVLAGFPAPPAETPPNLPHPPTPEAFGAALSALAASGAAIVGGCCGITPAHIRALAERLPPGGG